MANPKLRIVFYEDDEGKALSYFHLEKSEALRVLSILKILPELKDWTPASTISKMIDSKLPATLWAIQKLAGALYIDIKLPDGKRKVIAKRPVLLVRKEQHNSRNNLRRQKYLRASVCVKIHNQK
jgi:hypothetical protein